MANPATPEEYFDYLTKGAVKRGLDPRLPTTIAQIESNFNPNAVSPTGVKGLMQVTQATAADLNKRYGTNYDRADPVGSMELSLNYLNDLNKLFPNDPVKQAVAYNSGQGAVQRAVAAQGDNWLSNIRQEGQQYAQKYTKLTGAQLQPTPTMAPTATPVARPAPTPSPTMPEITEQPMATTKTTTTSTEGLETAMKYKKAGIAVKAIGDFGNQFAQAIGQKAAGKVDLRNAMVAAGQVRREGKLASGRITASAAASGVDVGASQSVMDAQRLQGIFTGRKSASEMARGRAADIQGKYSSRMSQVGGIMSLLGGYLDYKALGVGEQTTTSIEEPQTLTDTAMPQKSFRSSRGTKILGIK